MLSNAALRVDSVFSNDASCVAIHQVVCVDETPSVLVYWLVICVNVEEHR